MLQVSTIQFCTLRNALVLLIARSTNASLPKATVLRMFSGP